ncbi:MAG: hypothetical protein JW943_15260 [Deltaproteobacteria bacterium]|nr:hypothetical protein [Deltaproteobacteria bacterium]
MEKIFLEIGIEKEFFLLRKGDSPNLYDQIVEPREYEFPADAFGFLVELRSEPWMHLNTVKMTWDMTKSYWEHRADKFGMELADMPYLVVPKEKVKYFYDKYEADASEDATKNIYDNKGSHHLGMFFNDETCRLTAGMHVHFSMRDKSGRVIPFASEKIYEIVKTMDDAFQTEITAADRIAGEYEIKRHGFEYRSLPCNVAVYETLKTAFHVLRRVCGDSENLCTKTSNLYPERKLDHE